MTSTYFQVLLLYDIVSIVIYIFFNLKNYNQAIF